MENDWNNPKSKTSFEWDRSFSEPDLSGSRADPIKHLNRFTIRHPHEYISVDDLKFYRRKKPPDLHTRSSICLYNRDEPVLPFASFKTEYKKHFQITGLKLRPLLLRRATSLHLEGLMNLQSEHQAQYQRFTSDDLQSSRTYPIKNPENFRIGGDTMLSPEYRSSYISYPFVDKTAKILPREVFCAEGVNDETTKNAEKINKSGDERNSHLETHKAYNSRPSEYRCQFVKFPIEKAQSIPQISHFKMQGDFTGIAEYRDNYKMYDNYSKSAPIKKADNLIVFCNVPNGISAPEYAENFREPPVNQAKVKSLKTEDHLHAGGKFTKDIPEYSESFRDPKVKEMPERGKCREPYLRLKGKLEFNPEYRSTYLDFPRSRPIVKKSTSSFRLPTSTTTAANSPSTSSRRKFKSTSPNRYVDMDPTIPAPSQPEYRRAQFNYQIRERTPTRKINESPNGGVVRQGTKKVSTIHMEAAGKPTNKRRTSRHRNTSIMELQPKNQNSFENVGLSSLKKPVKFGRRESILQNAAKNRDKSSVIEGNPKYAISSRRRPGEDAVPSRKLANENQESFVVLDEPCKQSAWMKKSWYES